MAGKYSRKKLSNIIGFQHIFKKVAFSFIVQRPRFVIKSINLKQIGYTFDICWSERGLLVEKSIMLDLNVCGLEKQAATLHH